MTILARRTLLKRLLNGLFTTAQAPAAFGFGAASGAASWDEEFDGLKWLPFDLVTDDTIVIPVEVAGGRAAAMLDSGARLTVLSTLFAKRHGIVATRSRSVRGLAGVTQIGLVDGARVAIADVPLRARELAIADLSEVSAAFGRSVDIVLGRDAFDNHALAFDFVRRRLAIVDSGGLTPLYGWTPLSLSSGNYGELLVETAIEDAAPLPLLLDLGSSTPLMMSHELAGRIGLLTGRKLSTAALSGIDGVSIADVFVTRKLRISGLECRELPSVALANWHLTPAGGAIGLPILAQFDLILDVGNRNGWIRAPKGRTAPFLKDRSGLGVAATKDGLTTRHVADGSPAAREGWQTGERIVAVNGQRADEHYILSGLWRWRFRSAGTAVSLTLTGGTQRTLVLQDYY